MAIKEILTEDGFKPFGGFEYEGEKDTLIFTFHNGKTLQCALSHQLMMENGEYIQASWLEEGDILMGDVVIVSIADGGKAKTYNATNTQTYMTNGVISKAD